LDFLSQDIGNRDKLLRQTAHGAVNPFFGAP
jgi:hypothetical protein